MGRCARSSWCCSRCSASRPSARASERVRRFAQPPRRQRCGFARAADLSGDTQPLRADRAARTAFVVEESGTHERPRFGGDIGAPPAAAQRRDRRRDHQQRNGHQPRPGRSAGRSRLPHGLRSVRPGRGPRPHRHLARAGASRPEAEAPRSVLRLGQQGAVPADRPRARGDARAAQRRASGKRSSSWASSSRRKTRCSRAARRSAALRGGVDLDLEGGQSRVDFDLLGEPVPRRRWRRRSRHRLGARRRRATTIAQTVTDANLALHDDGFDADAGTRHHASDDAEDARRQLADGRAATAARLEAPTVEQPALYGSDNPTDPPEGRDGDAARAARSAEQTAELAIDDLGLDLTALDTIDQPGLGCHAGMRPRWWPASTSAHGASWTRPSAAAAARSGCHGHLVHRRLESARRRSRPDHAAARRCERVRRAAMRPRPRGCEALKGQDLDFDFNDVDDAAPRVHQRLRWRSISTWARPPCRTRRSPRRRS